MTEDCDEISLGIVLSTILFAVYTYMLDKLVQMFKIYELIQTFKIYELIQTFKMESLIIFAIYFIPLVILYVRVPILLSKHKNWQKYIN